MKRDRLFSKLEKGSFLRIGKEEFPPLRRPQEVRMDSERGSGGEAIIEIILPLPAKILNKYKKMKKISFSFLLLFSFICVFPQSAKEIIREIKNSGNYIWATGEGNSYKMADKEALSYLISQISVHVESNFLNIVSESNGNLEEFTEIVVKTYSNMTLHEAKSILEKEKKGRFYVIRYISKKNLEQIFKNRERKIYDYVKSALIAEKDLRIGDALKNYYWALVLLMSHKDNSTMDYDFPEYGKILLINALPERINNIFTDLNINITGIEEKPKEHYKAINMKILYNDNPVQNIDFTYWTGNNYSQLNSGKNGLAIAEFFGENECLLNNLKINIEYEYQNKTGIDLDVKNVFESIQIPYFEKSELVFNLPEKTDKEKPTEKPEKAKINFEKINKINRSGQLRKSISKVINSINNRDSAKIESLFTPEGYKMYQKLITNGKVKILPAKDTLHIISMNDKTIIRSVPMKFSFKNNSCQFIENVVFTFNNDGKIEVLSFAISDKAINDIVSKSDRFGNVEDKFQLINFIEHYKTAYCLKRLDYIESIFAGNALIIVGHVFKEAEPIDGMYRKLSNNKVKYIELKKEEYIKRLHRVFSSNEFINIHFEENIVKKVNGPDKIYGIQIKQDYYSTNYADKGYLFLMIDLNDSLNPKIYVRTWQPEKNPDGSIFGLEDFLIK